MKKVLFFSFFSLILMFMHQTTMNACSTPFAKVNIEGPSGRCAVAPNTPTTYTGTHNFSSNGCTIYEWTIEGGTITAPDGTSVTDGTICIVENFICFADIDAFKCDVASVDLAVGSGNGADVTVTWRPGVNGKLELKVKEKGEITLSAKDDLGVDLTLPDVTSLTASANSNTSTTFTANFEGELCPGMQVAWTRDGEFAGFGNPRTFSVGTCASGVICAFIQQTVGMQTITGGQSCRSYNGSNLEGEVVGPEETTPNSFNSYFLAINQPNSGANWTVQPSSGASIPTPGPGNSAVIVFNQEGIFNVCADGTTTCGINFQYCLLVNVDKNNIGGPLIAEPEMDGGVLETTQGEALATPLLTDENPGLPADQPDAGEFMVYPTLVSPGQELNVQLPLQDEAFQLWVTNLNGQRMGQQNATTSTVINTRELPAGIYILTAQSGNWIKSKRFIVR